MNIYASSVMGILVQENIASNDVFLPVWKIHRMIYPIDLLRMLESSTLAKRSFSIQFLEGF